MPPDDPTERLLSQYRQAPLPPAPQIRDGVWREIDRSRSAGLWSRLFPDWRELVARPAYATLALGIALVGGVVPGAMLAKAEAQKQIAQQSLHLDVFSPATARGLTALLDAPMNSPHHP